MTLAPGYCGAYLLWEQYGSAAFAIVHIGC